MLQSDRFSGAENVVCQIISMLEDTEIEFVYSSQDGQIREALRERNIKFNPVNRISISEFKRVIAEEKPDIIHAHDMKASFFAALSCGKIPLISHIHNNNFDSRGLTIKSILYSLAATKAKKIIWVSDSAYKGYYMHEKFKNKSEVLYNIINIEQLKIKASADTNHYTYDIVYLGRITDQKDPMRLLKVLKCVQQCKGDIRVAIIGTGDLEVETKNYANELGLHNNVEFLEFQSNPYKILQESKCMVMTSKWEGLPMCALESLALGVPVVSTPTDGLKYIIQDGENGYLSDDDQVLSEKLLKIVCEENLHEKLSEGALDLARKKMNIEEYRKKMISIYNGVK